ncbi:hypothetical protein BCR39DRAFT_524185 [Naematelia encephala]|uniref:Uncharacterized protein n=1 Tax=Naematelia encephala TaxID=71784 RepID=A0A1Y2BCA0_9TREE|nr:hypothetical protein BCR39DRAFT_524185 [Naematelia encephala]
MSSYDPEPELITPSQFRESMRLVRLQIAIPISVLVALGANLVCALAIKPGLKGINELNPTLLTPNSYMVGIFWAFLYILQVGFCMVLLLVRKDVTKETLVNGVGLRFAIANWLQAAWAVCWSLQFFIGAEVLILLNVINVLSIHLTLLMYPPTLRRPIDALFIHAPMTMLLAILLELDWMHNGFVALGWDIREEKSREKYTWQAVACIAAVNIVVALWAGFRRIYLLTAASVYILFCLLFSSPRTNPTLPTTALPKPTALLVTLIICLVLHPVSLLAGVAWKRTSEREGRIRLEEEVEAAEEDERHAEADAAVARA